MVSNPELWSVKMSVCPFRKNCEKKTPPCHIFLFRTGSHQNKSKAGHWFLEARNALGQRDLILRGHVEGGKEREGRKRKGCITEGFNEG